MTTDADAEHDDLVDLFENAPCGYLALDVSGRITRANATFCEWLGHPAEDVVGKRMHDFLNIAGRIYYETHFAPLLRMQGHFNEVALDFATQDGGRLPMLVNAVERRSLKNDATYTRVTLFNASDRRRYEQELLLAKASAETANNLLREMNATLETRVAVEVQARLAAEEAQRQMQKLESIGRLTGGIAHDFNNMLAVVFGALDLAQRRIHRGGDPSEFIAGARDGARRAAELTKRLLTFSRQAPHEVRVLNANRVVSNLSEILRRTLGEHVPVETVQAGGLWLVRTDQSELENVILNLAVNARDAMPDGGRITIETANAHLDDLYAQQHAEVTPGQYVMIAVSDTGTGMPPEVVARAFEPFFTTKEVGKGTGLGLSQVFGYAKQSRGHVKIYSEPGEGTSVKVYLPRHYGDAETRLTETVVAAPSLPHGHHIVLVEDEERVRAIAAASLRELGYRVTEFASPAAALEFLRASNDVKLLFTDIVMPGINGRLLAGEVLKIHPQLKILYTTGFTRNAVVHNGVLDPDVQFLSKPYTLDQLAQKLREVLD